MYIPPKDVLKFKRWMTGKMTALMHFLLSKTELPLFEDRADFPMHAPLFSMFRGSGVAPPHGDLGNFLGGGQTEKYVH